MKTLNFPAYQFRVIKDGKKTKIFDAIRNKYLVLTPEEWVRQHMIQYLISEKNYPKGLIAIERGLKLNGLQKRTDILIYSIEGKPLVLIELKAPDIQITQDVFDQIGRYNINLKLPYLIVSNGVKHFCAKVDFEQETYSFLKEIPDYHDL